MQAIVVTADMDALVEIEGKKAGGTTVAVGSGQSRMSQTWAGITVAGNSRLFNKVVVASRKCGW